MSDTAATQSQMLEELAGIGLDVARAVGRQATGENPPPAGELSLAYARVSRAVRLTLMLQSKLQDARDKAEAEADDLAARARPDYVKKARVERIVERLVIAEHRDDEDEIDRLVCEAGERLDDEDLYGDLMDRPLRDLVERLCADLGLDPDWTKLAKEHWAKEEAHLPREAAGGGPLAVERVVEGASGARNAGSSLFRDSS